MKTDNYSIISWNQIVDNKNILRPIFTFVPDFEFLKYLELNPNPISIVLNGTQWYDGKQFGTCYSSKDFPNYGPNFYSVTEQYVMVLYDVEFSFFPNPSANASFSIDLSIRSPGLSCIDLNDDDDNKDKNSSDIQENYNIPFSLNETVEDNSIWHKVIIVLLVAILFIIIIALIFNLLH